MQKYLLTQFLLVLSLATMAQTRFTERIQADKSGGGSLTLHQSQTITDLVNGAGIKSSATPAVTPTVKPGVPQDGDTEPSVTSGQKMRANGYRIQVYSGNNSRQGKTEAAMMGRRVKEHFSELPIYTNFVSPHWICRVGDFRTYEEASDYLKRMRETGRFAEAVIVRSKITIYY